MSGRDLIELREHGLLYVHALGHGLDYDVDVAEGVVGGGAGDQAEFPLDLGRVELARIHASLPQRAGLVQALVDEPLIDVLEHDGDVGVGDHVRDLTTHRPSADHGSFEDEHGGAV